MGKSAVFYSDHAQGNPVEATFCIRNVAHPTKVKGSVIPVRYIVNLYNPN